MSYINYRALKKKRHKNIYACVYTFLPSSTWGPFSRIWNKDTDGHFENKGKWQRLNGLHMKCAIVQEKPFLCFRNSWEARKFKNHGKKENQ